MAVISVPAAVTLDALFDRAADGFVGCDLDAITIELFGHSIRLLASCRCGQLRLNPGTRWSSLPPCSHCGQPLRWRGAPIWSRFNRARAREIGIADRPLRSLGAPVQGAMVVARAPGRTTRRWLLR